MTKTEIKTKAKRKAMIMDQGREAGNEVILFCSNMWKPDQPKYFDKDGDRDKDKDYDGPG